jgi:hypothetical protein
MLFKIVVNKMPRPQEVIVNFDENGMPRKETVEDTESSNMYSVARRILINLAETNWEHGRHDLRGDDTGPERPARLLVGGTEPPELVFGHACTRC